MSDELQAAAMASPPEPSVPLAPHGKVMAVTSGKGGVGKTFVSANLAAALAKRGQRVLVLDADLGLANLDVVLNLYPKVTLHDVFSGKSTIDEAIIQAPGGFSVSACRLWHGRIFAPDAGDPCRLPAHHP